MLAQGAGVADSVERPVVLIGHSYSGAVISTAVVGIENVTALVYVATSAPDSEAVRDRRLDRPQRAQTRMDP